jgi:hypothetical protein
MEVNKPLVIVRWKDAHGSATASYSEHAFPHEPKVMNTVGWLLRDDEIGVSVVAEYCEDRDDETPFRGLTFVPRGMVVEVGYVVKPRKPRGNTRVDERLRVAKESEKA